MKTIYDIVELNRFDNIPFIAQSIVEGFITGLHKSPFHGFSVEFAEHRSYNAGESTRFVDWKLLARTDRMYIKTFDEETNLRAHIVIDQSSSMLFPTEKKIVNKLSFSAYMSAALIHLLKQQRDAVSLSLVSDTIDFTSPAKTSQLHINFLYSQLETLITQTYSPDTRQKSDLTSRLHELAEAFHKRSLIIIFTDLLFDNATNDLMDALKHMRFRNHEIILIHTIDHRFEQQFDFENRPYRFIDMESGAELKLNPNEIRHHYQTQMNELFSTIEKQSMQYGVSFIQADIRRPFHQVLLPFLLKRSKMY